MARPAKPAKPVKRPRREVRPVRAYVLEAAVLPSDQAFIDARLDPRFCPGNGPDCQVRIEEVGHTFCPHCRAVRNQRSKRLWYRGYRQAQGAQTKEAAAAQNAAQKVGDA